MQTRSIFLFLIACLSVVRSMPVADTSRVPEDSQKKISAKQSNVQGQTIVGVDDTGVKRVINVAKKVSPLAPVVDTFDTSSKELLEMGVETAVSCTELESLHEENIIERELGLLEDGGIALKPVGWYLQGNKQ
ncbi:hypothetical protein BKA70DRAFT_1238207 [Coprinopsis sp. MPI-PUGE-AT-0042]|nr:hypothetical protein BKA70DRAFT_1238207 [Coprinopsis sp. MPI-PUGE-AT-0042]